MAKPTTEPGSSLDILTSLGVVLMDVIFFINQHTVSHISKSKIPLSFHRMSFTEHTVSFTHFCHNLNFHIFFSCLCKNCEGTLHTSNTEPIMYKLIKIQFSISTLAECRKHSFHLITHLSHEMNCIGLPNIQHILFV